MSAISWSEEGHEMIMMSAIAWADDVYDMIMMSAISWSYHGQKKYMK